MTKPSGEGLLPQGPFVALACFCERVLEDKDGVLSLIRVVDRVTNTVIGSPGLPEEMPPVSVPLTLVISLKSGRAYGRHSLKVVPVAPSGEARQPIVLDMQLEGAAKGQNVIIPTSMIFDLEGVYWFKVYFDDDRMLTQVPLEIRYSRVITQGGGRAGP